MINGIPVNGNTATDTLSVAPPNPGIALLKEAGPAATGPWLSFRPVNLPGSVFYRFTIENIGDVPLTGLSLTDPPGGGAVPGCVLPASLPVADAFDNDHIFSCMIGPVSASSGLIMNTATGIEAGGGSPVDDNDSALYASTGLSIVKTATPTTYTTIGDVINYSFVVTNTGFATLNGPVTIADDRATNESCPALTTIGDFDNLFDAGEQITCMASYTIVAGDIGAGSVIKIASASAGGTTSPTDTETVLLLEPRLNIDKSAAPPTFVAGQSAAESGQYGSGHWRRRLHSGQ